ncbi:cell division protein FtsQ/DivIB [Ponticoccus alexandrii]|uniref:Cell division protein FtsQ n=1 Tax=Ponticoccus alexandrii TaxID=1943633 RepID=A0ABX7F5X8_9RHOB|nr:cell division protein FtsQ/DivIB [Ponticoccus alexandrii]ETA49770.1 cell division protein FtsQ [Rhodobacteraceae bacterium PD-2]QRF65928.1 cell division protein FtsQ [Ponticoccus alexandrii]
MVEVNHDGPQMARLDPRVSRMRYRMERLMLTPLFRFTLRVGLPFALCFGGASLWFSTEANREAFNLMISDVQAAVQNRPEFQVKLMAVDGASVPVAQAIRAEIPVDFPISSFELDLTDMQARVAALDAVRSADLRIRQSGVLQVDVVERQPVVLWRAADGLFLLDEEGVTVGPAGSRMEHAELPVIAGDILRPEEAALLAARSATLSDADRRRAEALRLSMREVVSEALALYRAAEPLQGRLRGFERMGARRWDVVLDRDQRILLPESGAVRALEHVTALALAPHVKLLSRDLLAVDLRLPHRPTIRLSDDAMQEMWRVKASKAGGDQ